MIMMWIFVFVKMFVNCFVGFRVFIGDIVIFVNIVVNWYVNIFMLFLSVIM